MAWNSVCRELAAGLLFFCGPNLLSAQTAAPPGEARQQGIQSKIRVQSNLVVLSVTVKDKNGNLASGLRQEDFRIFDDGIEQTVSAFTDEGLPLSLVILVDNDLKWKEGMAMIKSLKAIVGGMSETDEAMVCRFDVLFYPGDGFRTATEDLVADLEVAQAKAKPSPSYVPEPVVTDGPASTGPPSVAAPTYAGARPTIALDDAVYSASELLQDRGRDRRKAILLLSDSQNEPKLNHHTQDEVIESLLRNNISVYALALGSETPKRKFSKLAEYASASGGEIFYATKSSALERLYSRVLEQARHDYTIAYVPQGHNTSSAYHALRILPASPGFTAATRSGYYTMRATPEKR